MCVLEECVQQVKTNPQGNAYMRERLTDTLEFLTAMAGSFEEVIRMPAGGSKSVVKLRGKVITKLGNEGRKRQVSPSKDVLSGAILSLTIWHWRKESRT